METEWSEDSIALNKDTCADRTAFMCRHPGDSGNSCTKNRRSGVRAFIIAWNPVNVGGAKGRRKVDVQERKRWKYTTKIVRQLTVGPTLVEIIEQ